MSPVWVIAAIAAAFGVLFLVGLVMPPPDPVAVLEREYVTMMRLGSHEGRLHLKERIAALREQKPGHTELWYLRWLVDDLRKAKRG
ncbi:MAG: hypothetical protein JNG84_05535 [Archangium sp.]|nr:hypothetical protein [Archangium sp.]